MTAPEGAVHGVFQESGRVGKKRAPSASPATVSWVAYDTLTQGFGTFTQRNSPPAGLPWRDPLAADSVAPAMSDPHEASSSSSDSSSESEDASRRRASERVQLAVDILRDALRDEQGADDESTAPPADGDA